MYKIILFLILFFIGNYGDAQSLDSFDDGNFTNNPSWQGDDSLFTVNSAKQLQSKGGASSTEMYLTTSNKLSVGFECKAWVRFAFNPSSQNFCRLYLCSDQANLKGPLNGYYLQFGGSTGSTDSISLYKQLGYNRTRIIAGRPGTVGKTNNAVLVKVTCDSNGNWNLFSDTSALGNYQLEGTGKDLSNNSSMYAGLYAKYTSGNANNFYLDDWRLDLPLKDSIKPLLTQWELINNKQLMVSFSEKLDPNSLSNTCFYNGYSKQYESNFSLQKNGSQILIDLKDSIPNRQLINFTFQQISDLSMNLMLDTTLTIWFAPLAYGQLIISELLPDPDPPIGLPNAEYIELYNNSGFPIQLNGIKISDGSSIGILKDYTLPADSFIVLFKKEDQLLFASIPNLMPLQVFPTLNNGGDNIQLMDKNGLLLHQINYDLSWFKQTNKQNGGYALELINPITLCKGKSNWQGSNNSKGGTPGMINSNWQTTTDTIGPKVKKIITAGPSTCIFIFDEPIDSLNSISNISLSINQNNLAIEPRIPSAFSDTLFIQLKDSFIHKQNYKFILNHILDCSGNECKNENEITYYQLRIPLQNQLVISEILFNPSTATAMPNAEFIELWNQSKYAIDLSNYIIKDQSTVAKLPSYILSPDSFVVLCASSNIQKFDPVIPVIGLTNFPSLNIDDVLLLTDENGFQLHLVRYKQSWLNYPMKQQTGGWTLEMIDPQNPCGAETNWGSSIDANGGTPGKQNSINGKSEDKIKPQLNRIYPLSETKLICYLNEGIDSLSCLGSKVLNIEPYLPINKFSYLGLGNNELLFTLSQAMDTAIEYQITLDNLMDCAQNKIGTSEAYKLALPRRADSGEIVINEILFNPFVNGNDFIELYNKTNKYLAIDHLLVANLNEQKQISNLVKLGGKGWLIPPFDYLVITLDANQLKTFYTVPFPNKIMESTLPTMNDDEGSILLVDSSATIFDIVNYSDRMHFQLLHSTDGVSLERLDINRPSTDFGNWASAAADKGYATPTYKNSQYASANHKGNFNVSPTTFSPDQDGYKDLLFFTYDFVEPAQVGKIEIYDSQGKLIRKLISNYYLGNHGEITWDGTTDIGVKAHVGQYLAYFESYNLSGEVTQHKESFAITAK